MTHQHQPRHGFLDASRRSRRKHVPLQMEDQLPARARPAERPSVSARSEGDQRPNGKLNNDPPLKEAADAFLASRERLRLSRAALRGDRTTLERLGRFTGTCSAGIVGTDAIEAFITVLLDDGCRASTVRTYLARLHRFFAWCEGRGIVDENPVKGAPRPRVGKTCPRYFQRVELERLAEEIRSHGDAWLADMVEVAAGTGMRLSELCAMRRSWYVPAAPAVEVRSEVDFRPKSHHERHVPIGAETAAILARRCREVSENEHVFRRADDAVILPNYASKKFKAYVRCTGLSEELTFHSLRHSYASWLIQAGADIYEVKELLGHASVETTQRYAHLAPKTLRRAVERVFQSPDVPAMKRSGQKDHEAPR